MDSIKKMIFLMCFLWVIQKLGSLRVRDYRRFMLVARREKFNKIFIGVFVGLTIDIILLTTLVNI